MTIRKTFQGGYRICECIKGCLISKHYIGYAKKEAIKLFKQETQKEN